MDLDHKNFRGRSGHVVVSAPGKVLVCGGYVVLNGFASLVFTTRARFYAVVGSSDSITSNTIVVESPQFGKMYTYRWAENALTYVSERFHPSQIFRIFCTRFFTTFEPRKSVEEPNVFTSCFCFPGASFMRFQVYLTSNRPDVPKERAKIPTSRRR